MRLAVLAMASVLSACGASSDPGDLDDPAVRAKLRELALQSASIAGVPSRQTMLAVWSPDHQAAEKVVSGSIVADHVPVYVVEMTGGTFTALQGAPSGVPPQGDVLTLTINAQTFEGTDAGIGNTMTDLRKIDAHVVNLLAD
jgi:hypothetical protein